MLDRHGKTPGQCMELDERQCLRSPAYQQPDSKGSRVVSSEGYIIFHEVESMPNR